VTPRPTHHDMVGWCDWKVLLQSASMLTLSNITGRHWHGVSVSRIGGHKPWLRRRVRSSGEFEIRALGLERVPPRWPESSVGFPADDPRVTAPRPIAQVILRPRLNGGSAVHGTDMQGRHCGAGGG
jgi:hypothetical protein